MHVLGGGHREMNDSIRQNENVSLCMRKLVPVGLSWKPYNEVGVLLRIMST